MIAKSVNDQWNKNFIFIWDFTSFFFFCSMMSIIQNTLIKIRRRWEKCCIFNKATIKWSPPSPETFLSLALFFTHQKKKVMCKISRQKFVELKWKFFYYNFCVSRKNRVVLSILSKYLFLWYDLERGRLSRKWRETQKTNIEGFFFRWIIKKMLNDK